MSMDAAAIPPILRRSTRRQVEPFTARDTGLSEAYAYVVAAELVLNIRARGDAGRPQDRLHQPQHLGRIRRFPADLGRHVRRDGARCDARRPGRGVATARTAHRARNRARAGARPLSHGSRRACAVVDWVAHGFEFVQSIFPGWRFQAADTVADVGLHGRCFSGPDASCRIRSAVRSPGTFPR